MAKTKRPLLCGSPGMQPVCADRGLPKLHVVRLNDGCSAGHARLASAKMRGEASLHGAEGYGLANDTHDVVRRIAVWVRLLGSISYQKTRTIRHAKVIHCARCVHPIAHRKHHGPQRWLWLWLWLCVVCMYVRARVRVCVCVCARVYVRAWSYR